MKSVAALAALVLLCSGCNPQPQHAPAAASPTPAQANAMPPLDISGKGTKGHPATITAQNGSRRVYQVVAQSYTSHSVANAAQARFNQPTVTFYAKDGTKLTARAPVASVSAGREVTLSGGVHAVTSSGVAMTCDVLTYDQRTEMLHGSGNVRITGMQGGAQQVVTGNEFTSDVRLTNMVMK